MQQPISSQSNLIAKRAEALAIVLLTGFPGVTVREVESQSDVSLIAIIECDKPPVEREFGVVVDGSLEGRPKEQAHITNSNIYNCRCKFPVVSFDFAMRISQAWCSWLIEPCEVGKDGFELRNSENTIAKPLNAKAVGEIVARVNAWYDSLDAKAEAEALARKDAG